jgi:hypothetical protein
MISMEKDKFFLSCDVCGDIVEIEFETLKGGRRQ